MTHATNEVNNDYNSHMERNNVNKIDFKLSHLSTYEEKINVLAKAAKTNKESSKFMDFGFYSLFIKDETLYEGFLHFFFFFVIRKWVNMKDVRLKICTMFNTNFLIAFDNKIM